MIKQLRGRPRSFDQDEVINEVMMTFWKHGYDNVSMDLLCRLTKLTKPSFYNAFESKEKLFSLCLNKYQEDFASPLLGQLLSSHDPIDGYKKMLEAAAKQFQDPKTPTGCLVLTGAIEAKGKTKAIDRELENIQKSIMESLKNYFSDHVSKGSANSIAQFVLGQLYAMAMFSRTSLGSINFSEFVQTSTQLMKTLVK